MPGYYTRETDNVKVMIFSDQQSAVQEAKELIAGPTPFEDVQVVESKKMYVSDCRNDEGETIMDLNQATTEWIVIAIK